MRNLFVRREQLLTDPVVIDGPDHHHLAVVLRVRVGETITLLDNAGSAFLAEIVEIGKRATICGIGGIADTAPEPTVHVTVAQALGKGDRFEQVIQHGTEVGASAFVPLLTERGVVRLDEANFERKRVRWERIAKGAAEQSGRALIPSIRGPETPGSATRAAASAALVLMCHPGGEQLATCLQAGAVRGAAWVVVGPEGGFTEVEVGLASDHGARVVSLGPHVLRTETAALVAVAQILFAANGQ